MLYAKLNKTLTRSALLSATVFCFASSPAKAQLQETTYKKVSNITTSVTAVKSTHSGLFVETPARDIDTNEDDKLIANSCIESGKGKDVCICETTVFKYEMPLRDYKAVAILYKHGTDGAQKHLTEQGYQASEISAIHKVRTETSLSPNFYLRCHDARQYYDTNPIHDKN